MSNEVNVLDLPDEMLEEILKKLSLKDRKLALLVCKRWSALKPFGWSSVQLEVDTDLFNKEDYQDYHRALLSGSRQYKHVVVTVRDQFVEKHDLLLEILSFFSKSVESLKLKFVPRRFLHEWEHRPQFKLMFFAKIAAMSSNLKHLKINGCMFESDGSNIKAIKMNNLQELYLKYIRKGDVPTDELIKKCLIPNLQDITPNITRLHLDIRSKESLSFLRHVSSQLVELEIWFQRGEYTSPSGEDLFQWEADFQEFSTMQFPLLEKLASTGVTDVEGLSVDQSTLERFYQMLRGLKGLALRSIQFHNFDDLQQLQSCENIQFLCLGNAGLELGDEFREISKLKHLKYLQIVDAGLFSDVFDCPPLQSLQMLSLKRVWITDYFEFSHHTFPSIAVVEMLKLDDPEDQGVEIFDKICSGMPFMKRLAINEPENVLELVSFLKFCAFRGTRELRIRCKKIVHTLDFAILGELRPIPIETLIMEVKDISLNLLGNLIKSMGELKWLELACTLEPESIRNLRATFPRCEIVEKRRVQIEEPMW